MSIPQYQKYWSQIPIPSSQISTCSFH
uniref:Uncharacterized protein n=1 Tax=Moniliophthora roreri TaxID=221103 RepID=A0A0W0FI55_MONRR